MCITEDLDKVNRGTSITMGGKIDGYLDCSTILAVALLSIPVDPFPASPYSYFAITHLRKVRQQLKQYNVEIE